MDKILKKAFIDAACLNCNTEKHSFSDEFDAKIFYKLKIRDIISKYLNTTGKKIACAVLITIICLTTAACSVKEIREPLAQGVEEFFINAKRLLFGTQAENIAEAFPEDVTQIIGTSHVSESKTQYNIDDKDSVKKFIKLFSDTYWREQKLDEEDSIYPYQSFDFRDRESKSVLSVDMCGIVDRGNAKVILTRDGVSKCYYIERKIYGEMMAFSTKRYYLHSFETEKPNSEDIKVWYAQAVINLDSDEISNVKKTIRNVHYKMEKFLLYNVSYLKEYDSIYWRCAISGEKFTDPITHYDKVFDVYDSIIAELNFLSQTINDKEAKEVFKSTKELWEASMQNHDLDGLFRAHEYIHDYDYLLLNYPTKFLYDTSVDYAGIYCYFGHLESRDKSDN